MLNDYELNEKLKKIFSKNLNYYLDKYNYSRNEFIEKVNSRYSFADFKYTTVTDWINGNSIPKIDKIEIIANFFGINKSDLIEDKSLEDIGSIDVELIEIPILGSIPAGTPVEAVEDIQGSQLIPQDALRYPEKEYFCLKISGSSMYPTYIDGDIVLFHSQYEANSGQDVCVYVNGYDATFKRLAVHEDGLELVAINPEYENKFYTKEECQELPVRVIGVAVKLIRNLE